MMLAPANPSVQLTRCTEFAEGPSFIRPLQALMVELQIMIEDIPPVDRFP